MIRFLAFSIGIILAQCLLAWVCHKTAGQAIDAAFYQISGALIYCLALRYTKEIAR